MVYDVGRPETPNDLGMNIINDGVFLEIKYLIQYKCKKMQQNKIE